MKYPRLPEYLDRRKKLMSADIKKIRRLRKTGIYAKEIAKLFHVSTAMIYYWTNEKLRQNIIKRAANQPVDYSIHKRYQEESKKYVERVFPARTKYNRVKSLEYYYKNKK